MAGMTYSIESADIGIWASGISAEKVQDAILSLSHVIGTWREAKIVGSVDGREQDLGSAGDWIREEYDNGTLNESAWGGF